MLISQIFIFLIFVRFFQIFIFLDNDDHDNRNVKSNHSGSVHIKASPAHRPADRSCPDRRRNPNQRTNPDIQRVRQQAHRGQPSCLQPIE